MQCSIAAAKATLAELIRAARNEEVILTDHGRPVARIVPYATKEATLEQRLRSLRERGQLSTAAIPHEDPWPEPTEVEGALAALLRNREAP